MMITLWPAWQPWEMDSAYVNGDTITIDGEVFDFSNLEEGYQILGLDVHNKWFVDQEYIYRKDGIIHITITHPIVPESPEKYRVPEKWIVMDVEGEFILPDTKPPVVENPIFENVYVPEEVEDD